MTAIWLWFFFNINVNILYVYIHFIVIVQLTFTSIMWRYPWLYVQLRYISVSRYGNTQIEPRFHLQRQHRSADWRLWIWETKQWLLTRPSLFPNEHKTKQAKSVELNLLIVIDCHEWSCIGLVFIFSPSRTQTLKWNSNNSGEDTWQTPWQCTTALQQGRILSILYIITVLSLHTEIFFLRWISS